MFFSEKMGGGYSTPPPPPLLTPVNNIIQSCAYLQLIHAVAFSIIETLDSISRDGPDNPIYAIATLQKAQNLLTGLILQSSKPHIHDCQLIFYPKSLIRTNSPTIVAIQTRGGIKKGPGFVIFH